MLISETLFNEIMYGLAEKIRIFNFMEHLSIFIILCGKFYIILSNLFLATQNSLLVTKKNSS